MLRLIEIRKPEKFCDKLFVTGCFIVGDDTSEILALFSPEIHIPEGFFPSGRGCVAVGSPAFFPWPLVNAPNGSVVKLNSSFVFAMANYPSFVLLTDTLKLYDASRYYSEDPPFLKGLVNTMTFLELGSVSEANIPEEDQAAFAELLEAIAKYVYMQRVASIFKNLANRANSNKLLFVSPKP